MQLQVSRYFSLGRRLSQCGACIGTFLPRHLLAGTELLVTLVTSYQDTVVLILTCAFGGITQPCVQMSPTPHFLGLTNINVSSRWWKGFHSLPAPHTLSLSASPTPPAARRLPRAVQPAARPLPVARCPLSISHATQCFFPQLYSSPVPGNDVDAAAPSLPVAIGCRKDRVGTASYHDATQPALISSDKGDRKGGN